MQDIAVIDDVFLTFQPHAPGLLGPLFALEADIVIIGNGFGANKAFFEIGMDDASGLGGGVADMDRPGACLFWANREIGLQAQQAIGLADQAVQAWL